MPHRNKHIGKLLIDLNRLGAVSPDLDKVFAVLFRILDSIPSCRVRHKAAILLFGSQDRLFPVAQTGILETGYATPVWPVLDAIQPTIYRDTTYVGNWKTLVGKAPAGCSREHFLVLPLHDDAKRLGVALLFIETG